MKIGALHLPRVFYMTPPSILRDFSLAKYSSWGLLPIEYYSRGLLPKYYSHKLLQVSSIRRTSPWKVLSRTPPCGLVDRLVLLFDSLLDKRDSRDDYKHNPESERILK